MTIRFDNDRLELVAKVSGAARAVALIPSAIIALVSYSWLRKGFAAWQGLSHATDAKTFYTLIAAVLGLIVACGLIWLALKMTTQSFCLDFAARELEIKSMPLAAPNTKRRYPFSQFVQLATRTDNSGDGGAYYIHSLRLANGHSIELPMISSSDDAKKVEELIRDRVLAK